MIADANRKNIRDNDQYPSCRPLSVYSWLVKVWSTFFIKFFAEQDGTAKEIKVLTPGSGCRLDHGLGDIAEGVIVGEVTVIYGCNVSAIRHGASVVAGYSKFHLCLPLAAIKSGSNGYGELMGAVVNKTKQIYELEELEVTGRLVS